MFIEGNNRIIFSLLGNRAADNFRNAADETKNRSGYGNTSSDSSYQPSSGSKSGGSSRSGSFSSDNQTATDKIKDKASELAQQAKSTVCEILHKISDFRYFLLSG